MALTVNVRFSAALAQSAGTPRLQMPLPEGATVGDLLDQLAAAQPHLAGRISSPGRRRGRPPRRP